MTSDLALPVDRESLQEYYHQVQSFQRVRAKSAAGTAKIATAVAAMSIVANLGLAWTVASMLPLVKLVPVYLWVRSDGTVDSSVALSRLPKTNSEAVIQSALWHYTRLREGFSYDTARYGYDAVSGMSTPGVRDAYQRWFNYPNPQSPQMTVGQKGQIDIEHISTAQIAPTVEQIRYRRIVTMTGQVPVTTTWSATLQYQLVTDLPTAQRLNDPGGVIVTSYQSAEDGGQ